MGGGAEPLLCPKCSKIVKPGDRVCQTCGAEIGEVSRTLTSGFASSPGEDLWERFAPGKVFANRYTIIEEIGFGGMGRVYKAIDESLGIIVALKIIRPEYASNVRMIEHFKKETILARSISSEYVVRVHDLGESEDTKYISMDYVEGQNLRDLIRASGSLTIATAVKFGKQICSALSSAHKSGIIHRDLKPSNVMIDRTGRVQVMDFGLAKTLDREEAHRAGAVVGTPAYMSPEQARGEKLDERTDIYALGLILYEMVTGCPVFEADSTTEYIKKQCNVDPEPPSRLNPSVSAALEAVILKCLKKNKNERCQTAEDVCQDLDLAVSPERRTPKTTRSIVLRWLVGVFACAAVILAAYFLFFRGKGPPEGAVRKSLAVMSFENITRDPSLDSWRSYFRHLLATDLEQSKFLRVIPRERVLKCLADAGTDDSGVYTSDDLEKIASRENVDFFLLGSYIAQQGACRIDIRLADAHQHETLDLQTFDNVVLEEIYDRCDEISLWVKEKLGISKNDLAKDFDEELKRYTTQSIEALICFLRGLDFYEQGDFEQSIDSYLKAIAIDGEFALAYARLAISLIYQGRFDESSKRYLLKAMSLRKNLTPRERFLIEATYCNVMENDFSRAIDICQNLLGLYPDDEMALEHMGAIYRNVEEWDKAERCFEKLCEINPNSPVPITNLSFIARAMGQYEKASALIQSHEQTYDSPVDFQRDLAFSYFCQGAFDKALVEVEKGLAMTPSDFRLGRLLGQIYAVTGHFQEALSCNKRFLENGSEDRDKINAHYWIGHLYLLQGKHQACEREIEEGLKLARRRAFPYEESSLLLFKAFFHLQSGDFARAQEAALLARQKAVEIHFKPDEISALHLSGLSDVGKGRLSEAKKTAQEMVEIIGRTGYRKLMRHSYHLEGMVSMAQDSWDEAIALFSKAVDTLPHPYYEYDQPHAFFLESLAASLWQRGDLESARDQYDRIISSGLGFLTSGDVYARSLYRLGCLCQMNSQPAKAREFFQKYLLVRSGADSDLGDVRDVRARLNSLS
jgi:serine/threonine protein kinase/tetratricopeptide (TPR) repeat protein